MTESIPDVKTFGNPPISVQDVIDAQGNTYCQVHTDRESALRCNNCGRIMCAQCAHQTPVGYRCRECVASHERRFFNADASYYAIIFGVCFGLGMVGAMVARLVGWWIFVFFISAAAGGIISEAAQRFIKGKRGRYGGHVAALAIVLASFVVAAGAWLVFYGQPLLTPEEISQIRQQYDEATASQIIASARVPFTAVVFSDLTVWLYAAITAFTVYGRFNIFGRRR